MTFTHAWPVRRRTTAAIVLVAALVAGATVALQGASASGAPQPTHGGVLRYGIDTEGTGFQPIFDACSQACQTISRAIFDPLTALNSKSEVVPYLAKSATANSDNTVWTIVARPGIKFTDGEALDGHAIAQNLLAYQKSPILASAEANIASISQTGKMTVQVTLKTPNARWDETLTGQGGWMMAPSQLANKNAGLHPIGSGPFMFKSWTPGQKVVLVRNPHYWQKGLPYLNEVDFIPIADASARTAALRQGQVDMIMTNDNGQIAALKGIKSLDTRTTDYAAATDEFVLNNETPPTNDLRVRKALAYATDETSLIKVLGDGVVQKADGPFPPGNIGYQKTTIMPTYNLAKAQALVKSYEAQYGPLTITLQVGTSDTVRGQLAQAMWEKAGMTVKLVVNDPNTQLFNLLLGNYEVIPGQLPGAPDPSTQDIWWDSVNVQPLGKVSLNYGRIRDNVVDQSLKTLIQKTDPKVRRAAAQTITDRFAKGAYAIWNYWVVWALSYKTTVHPATVITLPNGNGSAPYREGTNWLLETYISK
jgi:peptide/nickel transport system substrate-binding protein